MNSCLKIFLYIIESIFYPLLGLLLSILIGLTTGLVFLLYGIATSILIPFVPFFFICCLCGENGMIISKIFFYIALSSLVCIFLSIFFLLGGILISLCELFKNYYFLLIGKINPNNKFKKNYNLLLSFTFTYVSKIIENLNGFKESIIKKSTPQKF